MKAKILSTHTLFKAFVAIFGDFFFFLSFLLQKHGICVRIFFIENIILQMEKFCHKENHCYYPSSFTVQVHSGWLVHWPSLCGNYIKLQIEWTSSAM
jgi:hypothetical protein